VRILYTALGGGFTKKHAPELLHTLVYHAVGNTLSNSFVAVTHHFDAVPALAPGENVDAAPVPAPTRIQNQFKIFFRTKINIKGESKFTSESICFK
jgi:hypothetical protein